MVYDGALTSARSFHKSIILSDQLVREGQTRKFFLRLQQSNKIILPGPPQAEALYHFLSWAASSMVGFVSPQSVLEY